MGVYINNTDGNIMKTIDEVHDNKRFSLFIMAVEKSVNDCTNPANAIASMQDIAVWLPTFKSVLRQAENSSKSESGCK